MARNYALPTVKALFAEAASCAYPSCEQPLVFHDRGVMTVNAEIAHIRSEATGGPRYDSAFTGDLDGPENLLLLCGLHHRPVDRHETVYQVEELLEWKRVQRAAAGAGTAVDDADVRQYVRLTDGERQAMREIAKLAERVRSAAHALQDRLNGLERDRDRELAAFQARMPSFQVIVREGEEAVASVQQVQLSAEANRRHADLAAAAVAEGQRVMRGHVDALREEVAFLAMVGRGYAGEARKVVLIAEGVVQLVGTEAVLDGQGIVLADAVARLWDAATGVVNPAS